MQAAHDHRVLDAEQRAGQASDQGNDQCLARHQPAEQAAQGADGQEHAELEPPHRHLRHDQVAHSQAAEKKGADRHRAADGPQPIQRPCTLTRILRLVTTFECGAASVPPPMPAAGPEEAEQAAEPALAEPAAQAAKAGGQATAAPPPRRPAEGLASADCVWTDIVTAGVSFLEKLGQALAAAGTVPPDAAGSDTAASALSRGMRGPAGPASRFPCPTPIRCRRFPTFLRPWPRAVRKLEPRQCQPDAAFIGTRSESFAPGDWADSRTSVFSVVSMQAPPA